MKQFIQIVCACTIVIVSTGFAGTTNIKVGDKYLSVKAPSELYDVSSISPEAWDLANIFTSPKSRLLAVYLSKEDLQRTLKGLSPKYDRYMYLKVFKRLENKTSSKAGLNRIANQIRKMQGSYDYRETNELVRNYFSGASDELFKKYGFSMDITAEKPIPLGVFVDQSTAVGWAVLAEVNTSSKHFRQSEILAMSNVFVLIEGKLLGGYFYSRFNSIEDITWVQNKAKEWVNSFD